MNAQQLAALWIQACQNLGQTSLEVYAPIMAQVALLESSGNPNNSIVEPNGSGGMQTSNGLWQISTGGMAQPANWSDPLTNAEYAVQKFVNQGPTTAWPNTWPAALAQLGGSATSAIGGTSSAGATAGTQTPFASGASDWPPQVKLLTVGGIVAMLAFTFFAHVNGVKQGVVNA